MESKKTDWLLILVFIVALVSCMLSIFYWNKILSLVSNQQSLEQDVVVSNLENEKDSEFTDCCDIYPQQYRRCELYWTESEDWRYYGQKRYVCANDDGSYSSCERNLGECSCDTKNECAW